MKHKIILILVISCISLGVYSQKSRLNCDFGSIMYNLNCGLLGLPYNCSLSDCDTGFNKIPDRIKDSSKNFLISRIGNEYYRLLKYSESYIADLSKLTILPSHFSQSKGYDNYEAIKFSITYGLQFPEGLKYYIDVRTNIYGNILYPDEVPNLRLNKQRGEMIDLCDVYRIGREDSIFSGKPNTVSIVYNDSLNVFCWRIEKDSVSVGKYNLPMIGKIDIDVFTGDCVERDTFPNFSNEPRPTSSKRRRFMKNDWIEFE